jgi:Flavin reductase like domain
MGKWVKPIRAFWHYDGLMLKYPAKIYATQPPFRLIASDPAPRLEGALASIHCEPWKLLDVGDHIMVFGRVLSLHRGIGPLDPLLFLSGRYRHVRAADSAPAPDLSDVQDEPAHIYYG